MHRREWVLLGAVCAALFLAFPGGCTRDHLASLRGPGFDERSQRMTAEIPEREEAGHPHGFSSKAQEIEASFGFE